MEDEYILDYYLNILDIANSFDSLTEKISDENLVRKILRSLPKRFDMKVTVIEEAQYIPNMKVDELIRSLQTFELANGYKKKNIAFVSNINEEDVQCDMETDESILDALVRLGREFNKVLEMIDKKLRPNVQNISFDISRNIKSQRRDRNDENSNHVTTLTRRFESDNESSDEGISYAELVESFKELHTRSEEVITQLLAEKNKLLLANSDRQNEVTLLSSKLEKQKKTINDLFWKEDRVCNVESHVSTSCPTSESPTKKQKEITLDMSSLW